MQKSIEQTENEIQRLEYQVEQVQNVLQQIGCQLERITEAISRLECQGDGETSEALSTNLEEKQEKELAVRQEVSLLTGEVDEVQSRLAEAQAQNEQSKAEIAALERIGEDVGNALDIVSGRDAIIRVQEQQVRILRERLGGFVPENTSLYEPHSVAPVSERTKWVDQGIQPVAVHVLPLPEGIQGEGDFQKVPQEEMKAGILRLQEMRPAIEDGVGANSDYWAACDKKQGLEYAVGYQRIYDAFFGMDAIKVSFDGEKYDIINGRHRIWLAQGMGIDSLPMRVTRKIETQKV